MKYRIESGDQAVEFPAKDWNGFHSQVFACIQCEGEFHYFIDGEEVTVERALQEGQIRREAVFAKKSQTHKQITVHTGATTLGNTAHKIWVRR